MAPGPSVGAPGEVGPTASSAATAVVVDTLGSDADTPNRTGTPKAKSATVGNTFFGPDFNPERALKDVTQVSK